MKTATLPKSPQAPSRPHITPLMAAIIPPPYPSHALIQCHRCQQFGHDNGSSGSFNCMKCAGRHPTTVCRKPRHRPATCYNCGGRHVSAYKGCPVYQRIKRRVNPSYEQIRSYGQPSQPKGTHTHHNSSPNLNPHKTTPTRRGAQKEDVPSCMPSTRPRMKESRRHNTDKRRSTQLDHSPAHPHPPSLPHALSYAQPNNSKCSRSLRMNPAETHLALFQGKLKEDQKTNKSSGCQLHARKHKESPDIKEQERPLLVRWQKLLEDLEEHHKQKKLGVPNDNQKMLDKLVSLEQLFNKLLISLNIIVAAFDITDLSLNNNTKMRSICSSIQSIVMASADEQDSGAPQRQWMLLCLVLPNLLHAPDESHWSHP